MFVTQEYENCRRRAGDIKLSVVLRVHWYKQSPFYFGNQSEIRGRSEFRHATAPSRDPLKNLLGWTAIKPGGVVQSVNAERGRSTANNYDH